MTNGPAPSTVALKTQLAMTTAFVTLIPGSAERCSLEDGEPLGGLSLCPRLCRLVLVLLPDPSSFFAAPSVCLADSGKDVL